jgi:hypothetical protein
MPDPDRELVCDLRSLTARGLDGFDYVMQVGNDPRDFDGDRVVRLLILRHRFDRLTGERPRKTA